LRLWSFEVVWLARTQDYGPVENLPVYTFRYIPSELSYDYDHDHDNTITISNSRRSALPNFHFARCYSAAPGR